MKESIENFGQQNHLFGTLCTPQIDIPTTSKSCVVMLNSGLIYQAGPKRLYADMARDIAKLGFSSFRFDLSGIGDSDRSRGNLPYDEQIPIDIADALDFIEQKTGINSFILMGICTGADNSHKFSITNDKVTGTIFLDGYAYKTIGYYIRQYGPKIINPKTVARWFFRLLTSKSSKTTVTSDVGQIEEQEKDGYFWSVPDKEKTMNELKQLVDRNVIQLFVYTADWEWCFNHQSQFDTMYKDIDFKGLASCVYFDQSDHTYTLIDDRLKLINAVSDWLKSNFLNSH